MSPGRGRFLGLVWLVAVVLGLAGCVNVPTTGPVERIGGTDRGCSNCVNVEVAPPAPGDDQRQIVAGYLQATSNYQPNYSVARQFLTPSAAEKWSPEQGASIYRGSPEARDGTVKIAGGRLVGSLKQDRTYIAEDRTFTWDFDVVDANGEWRINNPPPGLMVAEASFRLFYSSYNLYFVGNDTLVPDPIYLPRLRSADTVASALVGALLNGPSEWLRPSVTTAIPPGTTLSVDSVTLTDGIAEVPLSNDVQALSDQQRTLLAAQVVHTLRDQVPGIRGVLFLVNQQRFRIPEGDPNSSVVSVDALSPELDPVPFAAADQLYAVDRRSAVHLVDATADQSTLQAVKGPLGRGSFGVNSLAVSVANTDLAVVTNSRKILRRVVVSSPEGSPTTVLGETFPVTDLLRPQFSRYGELWAVGRRNGKQQFWVNTGSESGRRDPITADAPALMSGGRILAFKISPDGTRMAILRRGSDGDELGLARITRADLDRITVDGWRLLNTTQERKPQVARIVDLAWLDATNLVVLGTASADSSFSTVRISADASQIAADNQAVTGDAKQLAVVLRTQTSFILDGQGRTYRDSGDLWQQFLRNISAIAGPG